MTDAHTNNLSVLNIEGKTLYIKDAEARVAMTVAEGRISANETDIATLKAAVKDGAHFLGKTTTTLTDGCHTTPVAIEGVASPVVPKAGDFVIATSGSVTVEFIWDGIEGEGFAGSWRELGSTGTLKSMAFVDKASTNYTPAGGVTVNEQTDVTDTVTDPTFTGTAKAPTGSFKGTAATITSTFTPKGTVSKPGVTVTPTTDKIKQTKFTLPTEATGDTPSNETLTISFEAEQTFVTGATAELDATPEFTGEEDTATGSYTPAGQLEMDNYTPEGTNSGTAVTLKPHTHGATFAGSEAKITVTPEA